MRSRFKLCVRICYTIEKQRGEHNEKIALKYSIKLYANLPFLSSLQNEIFYKLAKVI